MTVAIPKSVAELPVSSPRWIGRSVERVEDRGLVTGQTEFIDNLQLPNMLHCAILRSPYAHALVRKVDTLAAEKLPGVVAVVTGADAQRWTNPLGSVPAGWSGYCLAADKARFVGEPVAAVAATSRYVAEDALEHILVDYEPLPAVMDPLAAMKPGSPLVFPDKGSNLMYQRSFTWGDVDGAFAAADRVFTETFRWHRVGGNPIETFGIISQWDPVRQGITCRGSIQAPTLAAMAAAAALGLPLEKVCVIGHPHGGSFGSRGNSRGTLITTLLSRKTNGRPVKWIEDRIEHLLGGTSQSWDQHYDAALAVRRDGTAVAFRIKLIEDLGATGEGFGAVSAVRPLSCFTGCYAIAAAAHDLTIVATNKAPEHAYRGMGLSAHHWVLEQMMDIAARGMGIDPAEFRRRNFIAADQFPYTIPSGNEYDSGNYSAVLDRALTMADYPRLRRAQADARREGRCVGIGVVSTIEPGVFNWNVYQVLPGMNGAAVPEGASIRIDGSGRITATVGFPLEGQGQYTFVAQLLADYFAVELSDVRVVAKDTLTAPLHFGPGGSRMAVVLSGAVLGAAEMLREKLSRVAAHLLGADAGNVDLMDGKLRVRGTPGAEMTVAAVGAAMLAGHDRLPADIDRSPEATSVWVAPDRNPPDEQGRTKSYLTAANACHVVAVEVDLDTGKVQILKYCIADDCGTRLNPAMVDGMIQGGLAQGVGAALLEEYVYDASGQLCTSTLMDYLLPTFHDVPVAELSALVTPSPFTPLGVKGMGEAAVLTTPAAIMNAISDALAPLGVRATEVPATPLRMWKLLRAAKP